MVRALFLSVNLVLSALFWVQEDLWLWQFGWRRGWGNHNNLSNLPHQLQWMLGKFLGICKRKCLSIIWVEAFFINQSIYFPFSGCSRHLFREDALLVIAHFEGFSRPLPRLHNHRGTSRGGCGFESIMGDPLFQKWIQVNQARSGSISCWCFFNQPHVKRTVTCRIKQVPSIYLNWSQSALFGVEAVLEENRQIWGASPDVEMPQPPSIRWLSSWRSGRTPYSTLMRAVRPDCQGLRSACRMPSSVQSALIEWDGKTIAEPIARGAKGSHHNLIAPKIALWWTINSCRQLP